MLVHPEAMGVAALADKIRKIENWPQKGILFHDITAGASKRGIFPPFGGLCWFTAIWSENRCRGWLGRTRLHHRSGAGVSVERRLRPHPQKGKLPFDTISQSYALEYGEATVEIHKDAVKPGARVLLVDDLVATGGTMLAGVELIRKLGGEVVEAAAILEFTDLIGGSKIRENGVPLFTLLQNEGCM